jgi:hypothetical protein
VYVLTERGREVTVQGCGNVSTAVYFPRGQVYFEGDVRQMNVSDAAAGSAVRVDQA